MYDFNEYIDRKNTYSLKYDTISLRHKPKDILPLWVADMDFETLPEIKEALKKVAEYGIFGYSEPTQDYYEIIIEWFAKRYNWNITASWINIAPSVMFAISTIIQGFTNIGDSILIQQPVYYPFSEVVENTNRKLINNPLVLKNNRYYIDFTDFENKIIEHNVKIFLLCSPHNPVGRVWTKEELLKIGEICLKHNVLIIADEIHCDFIYKGYQHLNFANLDERFKNITFTCTSPSKSFNMASLMIANIIIPNPDFKRKFNNTLNRYWYSNANIMGLVACKSAYQYGYTWLDELNAYISSNLEYLKEFISHKLPQIKIIEPEGTYLVWLDFRDLGLSNTELEDFITNKARLWLDNGEIFGKLGEGFQRINIACPKCTLKKALNQLKNATKSLYKSL